MLRKAVPPSVLLTILLTVYATLGLPPAAAQQAKKQAGESRPRARVQASGPVNYDPRSTSRRQAIEEQVSLSASKIIPILQKETGLLLQVKKALVNLAFDQGRLLDEEDLTDEAVFRLIAQDSNVRAIATKEIIRRRYVAPLPTEEEALAEARRMAAEEEAETPDVKQALSGGLEEDGTETEPLPPGITPEDPRAQTLRASSRENLKQRNLLERRKDRSPMEFMPITPEELPGMLSATNGMGEAGGASELRRAAMASGGAEMLGALGAAGNVDARELETYSPEVSSRTGSGLRAPRRPAYDATRQRPSPYAENPALYDLYRQYSTEKAATLTRFASDIFVKGSGNLDQLPMDVPVGPDYVLGPGDGVAIELWGGVNQYVQRTVDRQGRVALPEVGTVLVAGRSLGEVQRDVQELMRSTFRNVNADVSLSRIRTVRVYVVGDVARPGAYDISGLSTPLNALLAAGGPSARGSMRVLRHFRGKQLVQEVDVYDLILRGVRGDVKALAPGDTILVPPLKAEVRVEGMVRRPAIYELNGEQSLEEVLALAGGVLPTGTNRKIAVERLIAHQGRTTLNVDMAEAADDAAVLSALQEFKVSDGDTVRVYPIVPYNEKTVFLDGHVFRPGKYAYSEGMTLASLIKGYNDLLPEPSRRHAEVVRLNAPDYRPVVIGFNLGEVLEGKANLPLQPFDTVRVFSRFDFEDAPVINVSGEVRSPGDHRTHGETHIRDAIFLAGGLTEDAATTDVQIFRRTSGTQPKVLSVNLAAALSGDQVHNIVLQPRDRVIVHRNLEKLDPPTVKVMGEVAKPGKYPLGSGMTASQLVKLAGGFKRGAYTKSASLARYAHAEGAAGSEEMEVAIGEAAASPEADVELRDGDTLTVRQITGWTDMGAVITVKGEVNHPGQYGIQPGERLSSILERAGGLRADAYAEGALFERAQIREIEEKSREDLLRRLDMEQTEAKFGPASNPEVIRLREGFIRQQELVIQRLRHQPAVGRLVLRINGDIAKWRNTPADIVVRAGDSITIPKKPSFVTVTGQVYNATAVAHAPGRSAEWYLRQAGGPTELANKKAIFIVRANGSVVSRGLGGWWNQGPLAVTLQPGDMIVVPEKIITGSNIFRNAAEAAQVVSAIALAANVVKNF